MTLTIDSAEVERTSMAQIIKQPLINLAYHALSAAITIGILYGVNRQRMDDIEKTQLTLRLIIDALDVRVHADRELLIRTQVDVEWIRRKLEGASASNREPYDR